MIKPYNITYEFYYDGECRSTRNDTTLLNEPREETICGTDFDGLWNLNKKYGWALPLNLWGFKNRFIQFDGDIIRRITPKNCKPWQLVITSTETTVSMERLMQYNSELVIQYLKERGITTCPMNF